MRKLSTALSAAVLLMAASCQQPGGKGEGADANFKAIDHANMDTTIKPGDNFFMYANGAWLKNNAIPKDQTRWGSFEQLVEFNYNALHTLLDSAAGVKNAPAGSLVQKVGDFYRTGMDSAALDKAGIDPIRPYLNRIDSIKDVNGLIAEITREHTEGLGDVFEFGVSPDDKDVTKEVCQFSQGGLGLPTKDYYTAPAKKAIRDAYQVYIPKMLAFMGMDSVTAKKNGAAIFALEMKMAGASMSPEQMRDPLKLYHKFSLAEADKAMPGLDWKTLLTGLKISGQDTILVATPGFYKSLGQMLKTTPLDVWKVYLKFHMLSGLSSFLSSDLDKLHFDFYARTLRGQEVQSPRWKRVMRVVDGSIGDLLGQLYVEKHFKPEAKKRMLELVNNLQQTFAERIQRLDWMSDVTKKKAILKLNTFVKKIGYPDKWKDYSAITITNNNYMQNIINASAWEYNYNISKLGKPVDRSEWGMTPPTVNAYYNPGFNEIVFPAGILQFPFFDERADDAVNYGGIGAVIGHEMTHGFDDQGRLYNAEGNLSNWWTSEDSAHFVQKANRVVDQFNKLIVIDTFHANGALTEGENLADLGGVSIAYEAFKKTAQGKGNDKIDGFTPDQRFFLSWAQVWRTAIRKEELLDRLSYDPHSTAELRGNVPLSNFEPWYKAFDIKPTDKMYRAPADRAQVW
ncbi:MAG: M13 family peptidase [Chitinophagia bacterium]|nr:M13 family peptidase [Chitinophagia bacterium]